MAAELRRTGDRGRGGQFPARLSQPGPRAEGRRDPGRGGARGRGLALFGGVAGDPGVRAHLDDDRQRLRAPAGRALPAEARRAAARPRVRGLVLRHALQRRHGERRDSLPVPGAAARVGARGGRPGRGFLRGGRRVFRTSSPSTWAGRRPRPALSRAESR